MTAERWARLKTLFEQALDVSDAERRQFAVTACAGDTSLERSLVALIDHHQSASTGLSGPPLTPERLAEIVLGGMRVFSPGDLVAGRFRVEAFVAEGGMGEVYTAEDLELNERVALKTIRPELAGDAAILARFKREIQLARKVTHPNVSRVFDLFRHDVGADGSPWTVVFLSMELLEGETLSARIRRAGPLPQPDAQPIALQLAAGLDAAHRAGIVHRDFKSGNVALVRVPGKREGASVRAVIMDFGLAATLKDTSQSAEGRGFTGTPAYMAPEQVMDGPVTSGADIYALGIVLFEMAAGIVPFRGRSPEETARLRLITEAPRLRSIAPAAPQVWERTVGACLQRDPARRPGSALEVADRLSGCHDRRRRVRIAAAGLAAIAIAGAPMYWARLPHRPNTEARAATDSARVKLENVTRDGFLDAVADYRRAIAFDPQWAQPWAEMAYAYAAGANAQQISAAEAISEARAAALQAIALDGRSAQAYGALGWVQSLDLDEWPKAETSLRRAVRLAPDDAQARYWLGVHLRKKGAFADAEREVRQAMTLSRQQEPSYWAELAFLYWTAGQPEKLDTFIGEWLVAYPNFGFTRFMRARRLKEQGRYDEALAELQFSERLQYSRVTIKVERASLEAYRGSETAARALLQELTELAQTQPVDTLLMAGVYARLGDRDAAFAWLDRGLARRDSTVLSIFTSPVLQPLREDPRFTAMLRRLHYAP